MAPTVTSRTLHSVSIGWDIWSSGRYPGEGSVRSYVARVWKDGNVIDVRKNSADITSIAIENLLEYTAYEFTVSIEDEEGQEGKQSPSVAKMTCGAPSIIPQPDIILSLKVPWNTAQIRLKTHDMTEAVHRCDGFAKLKLYVNREYGNNTRKDVVVVKESQDIYIEDLVPYSNFTVYISAVSNLNLEGPVLVLNGRTPEGEPGPPSNFTATSRSQTSLEFSWKAPRVRNGIITGYKIECYTDGKGVSAELSMHARSYVFKQLTSGTKYTCSLKAKTSAGYGNSSQLVTWTEPKDPEIGGIVGGVVGATFVAAVVVMAIVITLLRRRRREREANSSSSVPEREVSNLGLEHCSENIDYEHPMRHWQETLYTDLVLSSNDDVEQSGTGNLGEDRSRY
ncbi:protein sidekick-1-like [Lingula anatina]|uniref:Protein sidekick-1-like n=1 Tax=Lingula anatina TaxID=7574 RepID=A0A1S3HTT2_LINAN|nr:protein sidekick-1-like [Lingula anatina]|eukprot:XP_013388464.1 protein sidekick-1-like [Lingula anatina]